MIAKYKRTLLKLFILVQEIHANPDGSYQDCLATQEILIREITYIERRIRKRKEAIKNLKKQLGSQHSVRLGKEEAKQIKHKLETYQDQVDEYQDLVGIFREVGDALAFSYIEKWDIKPLVFKEVAGSLSGKKGTRLERKILRGLFASGHVALLNDITNCLRYGDITIPKDGRFIMVEVKSKRHSNRRAHRQANAISNVSNYLQTDQTQRLYGMEGEFRRLSLHSQEIHHRDKLNKLVSCALIEGTAYEEVEHGLFYVATTRFNSEIFTDISSKRKGLLLAALVNQIGHYAYYPITLSLNDPLALYRFYAGELR